VGRCELVTPNQFCVTTQGNARSNAPVCRHVYYLVVRPLPQNLHQLVPIGLMTIGSGVGFAFEGVPRREYQSDIDRLNPIDSCLCFTPTRPEARMPSVGPKNFVSKPPMSTAAAHHQQHLNSTFPGRSVRVHGHALITRKLCTFPPRYPIRSAPPKKPPQVRLGFRRPYKRNGSTQECSRRGSFAEVDYDGLIYDLDLSHAKTNVVANAENDAFLARVDGKIATSRR
jgi:hypothetical protein